MKKGRFAGMVLWTLAAIYGGHKLTPTIHYTQDRIMNWDTPLSTRSHPNVYRLQPRYIKQDDRLKSVLYDPNTNQKVEIQRDLHPPTLDMLAVTGKRFSEVASKGLPSIIERCFPLLENHWRSNYEK